MTFEQLRFVAEGDQVTILASGEGRRDGYDAVVRRVDGDHITVFGGKPGHERWRTVEARRVVPRRRRRRG